MSQPIKEYYNLSRVVEKQLSEEKDVEKMYKVSTKEDVKEKMYKVSTKEDVI